MAPPVHTDPATVTVDSDSICSTCTNNLDGKLPSCWLREQYLVKEEITLTGTALFASAPTTSQKVATLVADPNTGAAPAWIEQGSEVTIYNSGSPTGDQIVLVLDVVGLTITFQDNITTTTALGIKENSLVPSEQLIDHLAHMTECSQFTLDINATVTISVSPTPTTTGCSVSTDDAALLTVGDALYFPTQAKSATLLTVNTGTGAITWDTVINPHPSGADTIQDVPGNAPGPDDQPGAPSVDEDEFPQPEDEFAPALPDGTEDTTTPDPALAVATDAASADFPDPYSS